MPPFGENLRRERELRGVTLNELARATKISQRHLKALEEARFDDLPGGVISRGFVRSISRYLKLDEEHWVGEYIQASQEESEAAPRPSLEEAPGDSSRHRALALIVLLVLFGGAAYGIHRLQQGKQIPPGTAPAGTAEASTSSQTAAANNPSSPAEEISGEVVQVSAQELRLQVDTLEPAWVSIVVDGKPGFEGTLNSGDSRTVTGRQTISLTTRNASAVVLTLNGEMLPPLGFPGETKKITLQIKEAVSPGNTQ